jgi:hypothetical protein
VNGRRFRVEARYSSFFHRRVARCSLDNQVESDAVPAWYWLSYGKGRGREGWKETADEGEEGEREGRKDDEERRMCRSDFRGLVFFGK